MMPLKLNSDRNEMSRTCEPIEDGFLQWDQSCDSLTRRVNATSYSKFFFDDRIVTVGKLERVKDSVCSAAPGTVLVIDENYWHVAAADGVVQLSDFLDEYHQAITPMDLADQSHTIENRKLPILTDEQSKSFVTFCSPEI